MSIVTYPTPPYSNPPINTSYYQPSRFVITAISYGATTTITTSVDHNYVIGQEVRFIIPQWFGANQLDKMKGIVISIPADDQIEVDITSTGFTTFNSGASAPAGFGLTASPQVIAIGDYNSGIISTTGSNVGTTNIPGSFINISPE